METPLHVQPGHVITGQLRLAAHNRQSYDVFVDLTAPPLHPGQLPQKVLPSTPCAKEKKREDYAFWRQFNEKPSIIQGCRGLLCYLLAAATS